MNLLVLRMFGTRDCAGVKPKAVAIWAFLCWVWSPHCSLFVGFCSCFILFLFFWVSELQRQAKQPKDPIPKSRTVRAPNDSYQAACGMMRTGARESAASQLPGEEALGI